MILGCRRDAQDSLLPMEEYRTAATTAFGAVARIMFPLDSMKRGSSEFESTACRPGEGISSRATERNSNFREIGLADDAMAAVGRIQKLSRDTWGSIEHSNAFLYRSNQALGGLRPVDLFATRDGILRVEKLLNAILHGLPA